MLWLNFLASCEKLDCARIAYRERYKYKMLSAVFCYKNVGLKLRYIRIYDLRNITQDIKLNCASFQNEAISLFTFHSTSVRLWWPLSFVEASSFFNEQNTVLIADFLGATFVKL